MRRMLGGSRFIIVVAAIGSFLAAATVLVYGLLTVLSIMVDTFRHLHLRVGDSKHLAIEFIEPIDLFLLGTVLYIIALGLYDLFIDDQLPLPPWLQIRTLDDLKSNLIGVIIVLLAVTFLGNVVTWNGNTNILALGLAVGAVVLALAGVLGINARLHRDAPLDNRGDD
ncbi:MAG: hypothetical protein JWO59_913 [Chloroflexi bacterium]|nr:hypothetical protein [Chloroflexota bacterium]MDB5073912.1 hypothetical protein [Chloroflexota bacterium]